MAAAACIGVAELRELLAEAVAALQWAIPEGREAGPVEVPVSDEIGRELQERVALVATMAALPEDLRGKARTVFEREMRMARAQRTTVEYWPEPPEDETGDLFERLRRMCMLDPELAATVGRLFV